MGDSNQRRIGRIGPPRVRIISDNTASPATKARHPLREARVHGRDLFGKPGAYTGVARLRPHFQLEESTASPHLVVYLPASSAGGVVAVPWSRPRC